MKLELSQRIAFRLAVGALVGWTLVAVQWAPIVLARLAPLLSSIFDRQTAVVLLPLAGVGLWLSAIALSFAIASMLFTVRPPA